MRATSRVVSARGLAVEIERRLGMPLCREVDRRAVYEPPGEE
jgi:hypothetical protein